MARIGRKMREAAAYVAAHPGCTKRDVARHVAPRSDKYGYPIVDRAIKAGLIVSEYRSGRYSLTPGEVAP